MSRWGKNTYMKNFTDFGPTIKRHRIKRGMTQEDLCAATDYELQNGYLSQLESKPKDVPFWILKAIAKALDISFVDMQREAEGGEEAQEIGHRKAVIRDQFGDRTPEAIPTPNNVPTNSYAIEVTSTSMESTSGVSYYKGGYVIVAPCDSLEAGFDYVFRIDETLVIARYETDGRRHILNYLNPRFPFEILQDAPDVKGKVIGFQYFSL